MANPSTLRASASGSGSRTSTTNTANKENLGTHNPAPRQAQPKKAPATTARKSQAQDSQYDDEDQDDDADRSPSPHAESDDKNMQDDDGDDEDDGSPSPVRGRMRRVSKKQAQLLAEQEEADARRHEKAAKAAKLARKKAGQVEPDTRGPVNDNFFTSRTVTGTRPTATKNLAQRNSRVPPAPKLPSVDRQANTLPSRRDGHSHDTDVDVDDDVRAPEALHEPRRTFRGQSPEPQRSDIREPLIKGAPAFKPVT
ncbi:hypothetical protein B0H19DRAFT_1066928 [Mycena capillaripes]|nr:hypothetical protein B0H19DRAFT_1066928 [Mycena capillaripes]